MKAEQVPELLLPGHVANLVQGDERLALKSALEEQEDEQLYPTSWARELWIASPGARAIRPPPGEEKEVKTAIGTARARMALE